MGSFSASTAWSRLKVLFLRPWLFSRTLSTSRTFSSSVAQRASVGESGRKVRRITPQMNDSRPM